jgi:3-carboxy-cis,cis-muconate cycloisomerase
MTRRPEDPIPAVRLIDSLATTGPLADLFSDQSILQAMLAFEAALARAEARLNIIPQDAADAIAEAARVENIDVATLIAQTPRSATPGVPLVAALTERVRSINPRAAGFLHWGATSQDLCDTAMVLLLKRSRSILESDLEKLKKALIKLAEQHGYTVMLGRTLLQAAGPVTFGLKAASWLAAIQRGSERLHQGFAEALMLQFGGATGTLSALGKDGLHVAQNLAPELGLTCPDAPWHTQRDRLAALLCACGVLVGSLGKMARDICLLMQTEIGEVGEQGEAGQGGSSAMPHKRNPVGCAVTLACASRIPALVSSFLSAMVQEQERAAGAWQAEWAIIASIIQSTGLAVNAMAGVAEGLTIDQTRMRANIDATHGAAFAERAMMLLAKKHGRDVAYKLVEAASQECQKRKCHLSEVLSEMPEVKQHLDQKAIRSLEVPEQYLGVAEEFRKRLLASGKREALSKAKRPRKE